LKQQSKIAKLGKKTRSSKERSRKGKKRKKKKSVRVRKGEEKNKEKGKKVNSMIQIPNSKIYTTQKH